ncbi:NAD(P)H-dependent oxidoreductase [Demequina mangrovi]|uniref:Putative NADPH-quinone reductase (Modulator of drug activity B) n=1 Tax=Demequina mangrovi TaxID=1043493 RepID=A0A1H6XK83_9MICO|nr:NAD(P)H-dependent oxidoreductase [Demequina mangrovi]SEJ25260.1 Putative NADPH-quinone reductase (modulator of drug activity B) [Demequina mangrovi]
MNTLIVFDHPYTRTASENVPHQRSFTAAMTAAAERGLERAGHHIDLIDLHADGFNPVMSADDLAAWRTKKVVDPQVADYQRRVFAADRLVFAFPIWWESMPALTKGFLDRVLTKGIVYSEPKKGRPFVNHLDRLQGVTALTVMSTPQWIYRTVFGSPLTKMMFRGTFRKMGVKNLTWINESDPAGRTLEQRRASLAGIEARFARA